MFRPSETDDRAGTDPFVRTPAVWSDAAQSKTRLCAEKAGMGKGEKLQIVSEPEAAAVYALDAMDPSVLPILLRRNIH